MSETLERTRSHSRAANPSTGPAGAPAGTGPGGRAGRGPHRGAGAPRGARAEPAQLAASFARLFLEVEAGRRPAAQLKPLMDPVLFARLVGVWVRPGASPRLGPVMGAPGAPGCYEAVALVRRGDRCGALALRLRRSAHGWCVDAVARPEDGPLPPPAWPAEPPPDEVLDDALQNDLDDALDLDDACVGPGAGGLTRTPTAGSPSAPSLG